MKPVLWGKHFWYTIHFVALGYPQNPDEEDVINYKNFYNNLQNILPCYKCSQHYVKHLNKIPLSLTDLQNNTNLFFWTVKMHNLVNADLKKPILDNDEAWNMYNDEEVFQKTNSSRVVLLNKMNFYLLIFVIFIIVLMYRFIS